MHAITLLKSALSLLMFLSALGNNVPPEVHDAVISVSNQAIAEAIAEIQAADATTTPATTTPSMPDPSTPHTGGSSNTGGASAPATPAFQVYKAVYEEPNDEGGDDLYIWASTDFDVLTVYSDGQDIDFTVASSRDMGTNCIYIGEEKFCGGTAKRITTDPAVSSFSGKTLVVSTNGVESAIAIP